MTAKTTSKELQYELSFIKRLYEDHIKDMDRLILKHEIPHSEADTGVYISTKIFNSLNLLNDTIEDLIEDLEKIERKEKENELEHSDDKTHYLGLYMETFEEKMSVVESVFDWYCKKIEDDPRILNASEISKGIKDLKKYVTETCFKYEDLRT